MDTTLLALAELTGYAIGLCALRWLAARLRGTIAGAVFAFVVCFAAAYAAGIALEVSVLQIAGAVAIQPWLLFIWTLLGMTGFAIAKTAEPSGWVAMVPCCLIGAVMMVQGPLTADPLIDFHLVAREVSQYSPLVINATFGSGAAMLLLSVVAALTVGGGAGTGQAAATREKPLGPVAVTT